MKTTVCGFDELNKIIEEITNDKYVIISIIPHSFKHYAYGEEEYTVTEEYLILYKRVTG